MRVCLDGSFGAVCNGSVTIDGRYGTALLFLIDDGTDDAAAWFMDARVVLLACQANVATGINHHGHMVEGNVGAFVCRI